MARAFVIHSLQHARAALAAAVELHQPVLLLSAEGAAGNAGPLWFLELVKAAQAEYPKVTMTAVLDCGDAPGYALAALRAGCKAIRFSGSRAVNAKMVNAKTVNAKIRAIARQCGSVVYAKRPAALDLACESDPAGACRKWLGKRQKRQSRKKR